MKIILLLITITISFRQSLSYIQVKGKDLYFNNAKVYLSGVNIAWNNYDNDWGNGQYFKNGTVIDNWIKEISKSGGNTARVWLHIEGKSSPKWDNNGFVVGTDETGSLIKEMIAFLDVAESHNVFIIFVLWNAAVLNNQKVINIFTDDHKLQSYIDNALIPMVKGLHGKKALGAWEIINEPEGAVYSEHFGHDSDACFDNRNLINEGAGWAAKKSPLKPEVTFKQMLQFINWQTAAIHSADPTAVVTVGAYRYISSVHNCTHCFNYYDDSCLLKAGGKHNGTLDFYQIHTYENGNDSPIKRHASDYGLSKPLIIGEYSTRKSESIDPIINAHHYYNSGFNGALSWQYNDHWHDTAQDTKDVQNRAMQSIVNEHSNGIIKVIIN